MGATSAIEWTEATWNPLVGCTSVSPGCDNCYARTQVNTRFRPAALVKGGRHLEAFPADFDTVSIRPDRFLLQPLHWREPKRIFVNSLSDLFHKDVPDEFIARVFAVMALAKQHTFQLLTKRHGRMQALLSSDQFRQRVAGAAVDDALLTGHAWQHLDTDWWPLRNVWLGVSVESADWLHRVDVLRRTPGAVRWISAEPLLGPLDGLDLAGIDWVVCGGESGPGARPMHPDWARSLRDQCVAAGVPFLFKQWGNWRPQDQAFCTAADRYVFADGTASMELAAAHGVKAPGTVMRNVGKKAAGRVLDGRTWDEYPAVAS